MIVHTDMNYSEDTFQEDPTNYKQLSTISKNLVRKSINSRGEYKFTSINQSVKSAGRNLNGKIVIVEYEDNTYHVSRSFKRCNFTILMGLVPLGLIFLIVGALILLK